MNGKSSNHRYLLKYLNQLIQHSCPIYLLNERDDIVQTAFMRLIDKISTMARDLEACCSLLQSNKPKQDWRPLLEMLEDCLKEIGSSWDRKRSISVRNPITKSIRLFKQSQDPDRREELLTALQAGLLWLQCSDGGHIFAKFYVGRAVHWVTLDFKKQFLRRAEVPPEEQEYGTQHWSASASSWHRSLVIREEVMDCLNRLKEANRRPVVLALLGYQHSEIADFLELSVDQTESRIRRAIKSLRKCLNDKGVHP